MGVSGVLILSPPLPPSLSLSSSPCLRSLSPSLPPSLPPSLHPSLFLTVLPVQAIHHLEDARGRAVPPTDQEGAAVVEVAVEGEGLSKVHLGRERGRERKRGDQRKPEERTEQMTLPPSLPLSLSPSRPPHLLDVKNLGPAQGGP